jgi:hypothetical protein
LDLFGSAKEVQRRRRCCGYARIRRRRCCGYARIRRGGAVSVYTRA